MNTARDIFFVVICSLSLSLGACGIKPKNLDAPEGADNNGFPHTYPDPVNDPAGTKRY